MLVTLLAFFGVIAVLVLSHELGHFITAKASGVKVEEFGFGFPPRLLSIKRGETRYSFNLVPLGGFVKMAGEDDPNVAGSLAGKSIPVRLMILSAGSLMNFLLPVILFSAAFMIPYDTIAGKIEVIDVLPNSPAARAGIRPGDTFLSVNRQPLDSPVDLLRSIQLNLGREMTLHLQRSDGTEEDVRLVPRWQPPPGEGAIGIRIGTRDLTIVRQEYPFWRAIPLGVKSCVETFILFKNGIISMFIGTAPVELAGPVGIAQATGEVAKAGFGPLLEFAAFLSINLAIINIFPLPALDGGRIAFVLLELVRRGKRIAPKTEGLIHLAGFVLLMLFFLAVTYQDIIRIISGDSLIP